MQHRTDNHLDTNHDLEQWSEPYPWQTGNEDIDEPLRDILVRNRTHIFRSHHHGELMSTFNFALTEADWVKQIHPAVSQTRVIVQSACKVNIALGYVLENRESGELRYFVPGDNFPTLKSPMRIDRQTDWNKVLTDITPEKIDENAKLQRPDTKWKLRLVTNVNIFVWYMDVVMGQGYIPDYIRQNKNIVTLTHERLGNMCIVKACMARCLAYYRLSDRGTRPGAQSTRTG